jgi:acetoin utilization deacetylase AcuC-like enzyme
MTLVYRHSLFQQHETGSHPETPLRLAKIDSYLNEHTPPPPSPEITAVSNEQLNRVHTLEQIKIAQTISEQGGGQIDPDTICSAKSYEVALKAAGCAVSAVDQVLDGHANNALCLIRPPGHHATEKRSMGFCLFNNIAVAADHAIRNRGLGRVLIVDWDVHHGNGTQDIFYNRDDVYFLSIHRFPFYPGTGSNSETGTAKGLGYTKNVPVMFGTPRDTYLDMFQSALDVALTKIKPELILISAGFDAHAADPIGSLGLMTSDFSRLTTIVRNAAEAHCNGRIVSCLEGGYNLNALGESVVAHLEALEK